MIRYRKLGYVAMNVTDLDRSAKFYRDTVGLQPVAAAAGETARFFRCDWDHHNVMLFEGPRAGLKRRRANCLKSVDCDRYQSSRSSIKSIGRGVPRSNYSMRLRTSSRSTSVR